MGVRLGKGLYDVGTDVMGVRGDAGEVQGWNNCSTQSRTD
jgi:hypothetical protein